MLAGEGVPEELARKVAMLEPLRSALDIVHASIVSERPVEEVGQVYFALGSRLQIDWLRSAAQQIVPEDHWERLALDAMVDDLFSQQRALTNAVFSEANGHAGLAALDHWRNAHERPVKRTDQLVGDFRVSGGLDLAKLAFANRQLRAMIN
jgi:glutamate dehydrogenase